jgi:hypothetical protein
MHLSVSGEAIMRLDDHGAVDQMKGFIDDAVGMSPKPGTATSPQVLRGTLTLANSTIQKISDSITKSFSGFRNLDGIVDETNRCLSATRAGAATAKEDTLRLIAPLLEMKKAHEENKAAAVDYYNTIETRYNEVSATWATSSH